MDNTLNDMMPSIEETITPDVEADVKQRELHAEIMRKNPNAAIYETPEGELLYCDTARSFYDNDGDVRDVVVSGNDGTETFRSAGWAAINKYKLVK